ncbi:MAG: CPBP family intramembrane metalloprotease [Anaerolineae bacterium]|nr:CPBP family intramembrane metalloprotease [Anaerolineae bacterium]
MTIPTLFDPEESEEKPSYTGIHHAVPLKHGSLGLDLFVPPVLPTIDIKAARQPLTPGMPPLRHIPLQPPETYRPMMLPLESGRFEHPSHSIGAASDHPVISPSERVRFPVAEPPAFKHLKPAPSVAGQMPVQESVSIPATTLTSIPVAVAEPMPSQDESSISQPVDPFFALLIYLALGLGTWVLSDLESRYTVLWMTLIVIGGGMALLDTGKPQGKIVLGNLSWGLVFGLPIGLMLLVFAPQALSTTSSLLFPNISLPALFQMLAITAPLGETLFFRGGLQDRHGMVAGIIGAGLATLVLFLPAAMGTPEQLTAVAFVALFLTLLAGVYSYIRERYGLAASYACQVTINVMLFVLPRLVAPPIP